MATGQKISDMFIEISAKADKLYADMQVIKREAENKAKGIESAFEKVRLSINTSSAKKSLSDMEKMASTLRTKLSQKIALNADMASIDRTRNALLAVEERLGGLKTKSTATTGSMVSGFGKVFAALGGMYLLKKIGGFLFDISSQAAKVEESMSFFKGTTTDIMNFRKAVDGTVSDANLVRLSNQANDLGITLQDQPLLFALANRAAEAYGTSVEEGFAKVVMATEGNVRALRAIGVQKGVYNELVKAGAREHGGLITEMDSETQKQIRLDAIIKASGMTMEDVNKQIKSHADQIESAGVKWDNFLNKLGTKLAPVSAKIAEFFQNAMDAMDPESLTNVRTAIKEIETFLNTNSEREDQGWAFASKERIAELNAELTKLKEKEDALTGKTGLEMPVPADAKTGGRKTEGDGLSPEAILAREEKAARVRAKELSNERDLITTKQKLEEEAIANEHQRELAAALHRRELREQEIKDRKATSTEAEPYTKKMAAAEGTSAEVRYQAEVAEIERKNLEKRLDFQARYNEEVKALEKSLVDVQIKDYALTVDEYAAYLDKLLALDVKALEEKNRKIAEFNAANPNNPLAPFDVEGFKTSGKKQNEMQASDYKASQQDAKAKKWRKDNKLLADSIDDVTKSIESGFMNALEEFTKGNTTAGEMVEQTWKAISAAVILEIEKIILKMTILKGVEALLNAILPGAGTVVSGGADMLSRSHSGGDWIGTGRGVKRMRSGGSFTVPSGFPNDSFPLMVETGERVSVTPAGRASDNSQISKQLAAMNMNLMAQRSKSQRLSLDVGVRGEIANQSIALSSKRGQKIYDRLRGTS
jgi:hypothetical protein